MKQFSRILKAFLWSTVLLMILFNIGMAQTQYKLHISNIQIPEEKEKTWFGRPTHNDFIVTWDLYKVLENDELQLVQGDESVSYNVYMAQEDSTFVDSQPLEVGTDNSATFLSNEVNKRYYFRVDGLKDSQVLVQSDVVWAIGGRPKVMAQADGETTAEGEYGNFPFPLFFPLAEVVKLIFNAENSIYSHSSFLGKASFTLVWFFFIAGLFVVFRRAIPNLSYATLFPFSKSNHVKAIFQKDDNYQKCLSPSFRFFIEAWKNVIAKSHFISRERHATSADSIDKLHFDHFRTYGQPALDSLRKLIYFNPANGDKNALVEELRKHFGAGAEFGNLMEGKIGNGIPCESTSNGADFTWNLVESELMDQKSKPLVNYPTVKILLAGLENHIVNGYNWENVSGEVDRAVENRADAEIQNLRSNSALEWLWNMGAMAPLLGLFGTVTGISKVFQNINTEVSTEMTQSKMINILSGGIFEALYTTIYGLIVGIILMLLYYRYKNDLEWIHNKWQSIFVHVTEKL